jgi:diguanylate cyclase
MFDKEAFRVPPVVWWFSVFSVFLPLLGEKFLSIPSRESIWLLSLLPSFLFSFFADLKSGLTATCVVSLIHGIWEWKESFEGDLHPGELCLFTWILLLRFSLALGFGVLADRLKRKQAALKRMNRQLKQKADALIQASPLAIVCIDMDKTVTLWNEMAVKIFGWEEEEMLGKPIAQVIPEEEHSAFLFHFMQMRQYGTVIRNMEVVQRRKDGSRFYVNLSASPMFDEEGKMIGVVAMMDDITERKQTIERIHYLANHDPLTDLPNRRLFFSDLVRLWNQAQKHADKFALLFLDMDRFKTINDTLGHDIGDALLKRVAKRIKDTLGPEALVARLGGDEFTITLPKIAGQEEVKRVAQHILDAFQPPFHVEGYELHITPSIGIAVYPDHGTDAETLIKRADLAMYHAKEKGENTYCFYKRSMDLLAIEHLKLENQLHKALDQNQFRLYYQPKVDMKTRRMIGMEALIRWLHPELGLVSPGTFIPLAEVTGIIVPLGEWALQTACRQLKEWMEKGYALLPVSVNLSARQFRQDHLVTKISDLLKKTGLKARWLELEITESAIMNNVEDAICKLNQLREMGVRVSIDDFGTGYSSLNYLKKFPIDTLKIDQSFVRDLSQHANDRAIVTSIISLAHNLKLQVIAEGVETEEQYAYLLKNGCHGAQGYLFGRPVPAHEFEKLLNRRDKEQAGGDAPAVSVLEGDS